MKPRTRKQIKNKLKPKKATKKLTKKLTKKPAKKPAGVRKPYKLSAKLKGIKRTCQFPSCAKVFSPTKVNQRYHEYACKNRDHQRRIRERARKMKKMEKAR